MRMKIEKALREHEEELVALSRRIHQSPELSMEESQAAEWQKELLRGKGFQVEDSPGGLETAFKATWGGSKPVVCFISEYDALPITGHGCGHNLIAFNGLACGLALRDVLRSENLPGSVVVMGTPGEEGKGGKVIMVEKGAFKGVDVAFEAHPFYRTVMDPGSLSVSRYEVDFYGFSSHAAVNPESGKNALDAVMLLFQGVNAWRQHLPESTRVHGIVTEGGAAPNVIPDYAGCLFYLRALDKAMQPIMKERFENIVKGAALMTDTKPKINALEPFYESGAPNGVLNDEFFRLAAERGLKPNPPKRGGRVSTDFGNVSQIIPSIHVYYGITDGEIPLHSLEFNEAAVTDVAFERTMTVSGVLVEIALRYVTDEAFRTNVRKEFETRA